MKRPSPHAFLGGAALLLLAGCRTVGLPAGTHELDMAAAIDGQRLSYLVTTPSPSDRPAEGWPLLLFLHGAGERGHDLARVGVHGPPKLVGEIPELAGCVLVAPQCPSEQWWQTTTLRALIDEVLAQTDVDPTRIYITGLSMGGYGTWGMLARYPDLFAAAVPICGGGQTGRLWPSSPNAFAIEDLLEARDVAIRAFHGEADTMIPVAESIVLVDALRAVSADVELTIYPGVGHDSWTQTYLDPELYRWLFAQ